MKRIRPEDALCDITLCVGMARRLPASVVALLALIGRRALTVLGYPTPVPQTPIAVAPTATARPRGVPACAPARCRRNGLAVEREGKGLAHPHIVEGRRVPIEREEAERQAWNPLEDNPQAMRAPLRSRHCWRADQ